MFVYQPTRWAKPRRGFVVVVITISLIALFGITALAIDGGLLLTDRAKAQAAADAAALAAAIDLYQNFDSNQGADPDGDAATSAQDTAKDNGFTNNVGGVTVKVNIPPLSGTYQRQAGYAEVIITFKQTKYFSSIWGKAAVHVQARAVARGAKAPRNNGIIVLDPKDSNTLMTSNTADIAVTDASIVVDSTDGSAGKISNSGNITADTLDFSGKPGYSSSGTGQFIGTKLSSQTPTPDPLRYLPPPSEPTLSWSNVNISNLPKVNGNVPGYPTPGDLLNGWTLPAGEYNNGINISDNNSSHTYTLESGCFTSMAEDCR
jgi:hypothetical protein